MDPQQAPRSGSLSRAASGATSTTQPSAFSHLLHDRGVRFAAGLAVVVAIPVAVLFYFQFRSLERHRRDVGGRPASIEPRHRRFAGARDRRNAQAPAHRSVAAARAAERASIRRTSRGIDTVFARAWAPARSSRSCGCGRRTPEAIRRQVLRVRPRQSASSRAGADQPTDGASANRPRATPSWCRRLRELAAQRRAIVAFPGDDRRPRRSTCSCSCVSAAPTASA